MGEFANRPDPAGWLGAAFERTRQDSVLVPKQPRPDRGEFANRPDPAGWLGAAFERTRQDSVLVPKQPRPDRGEFANRPDPAGWLGAAFERTRQDSVLVPKQPRPDRGQLRLRGTKALCKSRLNKALSLVAEKMNEGVYRVSDAKTLEGDPTGVLPLDEWLNEPVMVLRRLYPGSAERVLDLEGWNSYWVNLTDPQIEPCYCRDMYVVAPSLGTPCKHVLAALLADEDQTVTEAADELKRRNAIAAALKG